MIKEARQLKEAGKHDEAKALMEKAEAMARSLKQSEAGRREGPGITREMLERGQQELQKRREHVAELRRNGKADEAEKAAKAAGATIVAREFTNDKATDFKAILTKIKAKKPDVIFLGGMDAVGGPMLKQMKELGIAAKFTTGDGGCSPELIKLAGPASEGVVCTQAGLPVDKLPNGQKFVEDFTKKYGQIQIYSPYSYDAVMVLVDAMKRANSADPVKYLPEVGKTSYDGVTGRIEFDEKGDIKNGAITVFEIKDGKLVTLKSEGGTAPAAPAAAPAPAPAAAPAPAPEAKK